jgi:hypothetical protein
MTGLSWYRHRTIAAVIYIGDRGAELFTGVRGASQPTWPVYRQTRASNTTDVIACDPAAANGTSRCFMGWYDRTVYWLFLREARFHSASDLKHVPLASASHPKIVSADC